MRALALFGLVTAVVVPVVAWRFLVDLDRDLDQSLAIGEDAAATLSETIDVAADVIAALDDGLGTLAATLRTLDDTLTDTSELATTTSSLAASLPASFDDIDAALATVESLSGTIDAALRGVSRVPFGPDYDPDVPLPEAVAGLRAAFGPIGDDLATIAVELDGFARGSADLSDRTVEVRADLERTRLALADSSRLLDAYRDAAERAGEIATSSRADLRHSFRWVRFAIVLVGILIALSQYVPWWLGTRLRVVADPSARPGTAAAHVRGRELESVT
jgi:ABC-type transporter Mla subunit MlaD